MSHPVEPPTDRKPHETPAVLEARRRLTDAMHALRTILERAAGCVAAVVDVAGGNLRLELLEPGLHHPTCNAIRNGGACDQGRGAE